MGVPVDDADALYSLIIFLEHQPGHRAPTPR